MAIRAAALLCLLARRHLLAAAVDVPGSAADVVLLQQSTLLERAGSASVQIDPENSGMSDEELIKEYMLEHRGMAEDAVTDAAGSWLPSMRTRTADSILQALASLGPGPGEWSVESPAAHGVDPAVLKRDMDAHFEEPELERDSLLIVKDGAIIYERYNESYGFTRFTANDAHSITKTCFALLLGWATSGLLDLDAPISRYGIKSPKPYDITTRQVLSQALYGNQSAGEDWAYDVTGRAWLHLMNDIFVNTTRMPPSVLFRNVFQRQMGLSNVFYWDGLDRKVTTGVKGTIRDLARFGQLMLNRGHWRTKADESAQLVPAWFMDELNKPQTRYAPHQMYSNACYGLTVWLNPNQPRENGPCLYFSESWTHAGRRPYPDIDILKFPAGSSLKDYTMGGTFGQVMMVMPEQKTVAISFGNSHDQWGGHVYAGARLARSLCASFHTC